MGLTKGRYLVTILDTLEDASKACYILLHCGNGFVQETISAVEPEFAAHGYANVKADVSTMTTLMDKIVSTFPVTVRLKKTLFTIVNVA